MSEASIGERGPGAFRDNSTTRGVAKWLGLAAAPTFAIMTAFEASAPNAICSASSPLNGMTTMYALMSAFHLAPWLRLISSR